MDSKSEELFCPFCREEDFDKIGLKDHLEMGRCKEYNETMTIVEEERKREHHDDR